MLIVGIQFSFFIIVASASAYAEHLGGSAVFAGLAIGIPTVFSGFALFFIDKYNPRTLKHLPLYTLYHTDRPQRVMCGPSVLPMLP